MSFFSISAVFKTITNDHKRSKAIIHQSAGLFALNQFVANFIKLFLLFYLSSY